MPGFPGLHYLLEFAQTNVHWVSSAIQPCHPLLLPSPLALNHSQHQSFSNELAFRIRWPEYWCFSFSISASSEIQGSFPLGLTGLISLLSKRLSRVFSSTVFQKHQFFGIQPSLWSNSHIHTWLLEKPYRLVGKVMSLLLNTLSRFVISFLPRNAQPCPTLCDPMD